MTQEKQLGRYTILRELGRGAIGAVYAARHQTSGANVALKTLDPALLGAADAKLSEVFLKNARSAGRLRHASIIQVHEAGEAGGTAYVAMDLVEGRSLRSLLDERPLSIARAVRIFDDIASALAYAHEEGVVHRGVKPSNVIVAPSGAAKIGDFGFGQVGEAALRYMSPEQVRGQPVDARSDLFSLGAVFYEMLTRQAPFSGNSPQEIKQSILHADPTPPSELNPLVPDALDRIVLGLLTLRPDGRPANARILLRDLQRVEEGLGLGASIDAAPAQERHPRMNPSGAVASAPPSRPEPALRIPEPSEIPERTPTRAAPPLPPTPSAPPPRIPRPNAFSETGDFGGFRPGAADADVLPDRPLTADPEDFDHRKAMMERGARRGQPSGSRAGMLTALGVMLAVAGVGAGGYIYYLSGSPAASLATAPAPAAEVSNQPVAAVGAWKSTRPQAVAAKEPEAPIAKEPPVAPAKAGVQAAEQKAPALNTPRPIAPAPVAKAITEPAPAPAPAPVTPKMLSAEANPLAQDKAPTAEKAPAPAGSGITVPPSIAEAPKQPATVTPSRAQPPIARAPEKVATAAPPQKAPRAAPPAAAAAPKAAPARKAQLVLVVSPGGDVYINGELQGTTPETTTFDLDPGMHQVEIRSGSRKPYLTYVTVEPGDQRRIRHDFDAKPSRPPT